MNSMSEKLFQQLVEIDTFDNDRDKNKRPL